jgi:prophage DNA circulation protein
MSWREQWQEASFRGVSFKVQDHDASGGRRVASHEYPQRDAPYTEDMGRKQRTYSISALVIGADYRAQRDDLVKALEQTGAGLLVHPWLGRLQVVVTGYSVSESTSKGGQATIHIQCAESGAKPAPASTIDTPTKVSDSANALRGAAYDEFTANYGKGGLTGSVLIKAQQALSDLSSRLHTDVASLQAQVTAPGLLAQNLINTVADVVALTQSTTAAIARTIKTPLTWPLGASSQARASNMNGFQIDALTNVVAIAAIAIQASTTDFVSQPEAQATQAALVQVIDQQMQATGPGNSPLPDNLYLALYDLQATVMQDIQVRGLLAPRVRNLVLPKTLPSLVLAWQLYGDIEQETNLVSRNHLRWPGFVPAGVELEVLVA